MEKDKAVKYIANKISKLALSGKTTAIDCELVAIEIYTYMVNLEKINRMSTGKCQHEDEVFQDDSYYPEMSKQKCKKCGRVKLTKPKK